MDIYPLPKKLGRPTKIKNTEEVIHLYLMGESKDAIAKIFGVTSGTILKIIRDNNIVRTLEQEKLSKSIRNFKFKNTLLDRYGVSSTMSSPEILSKSKATCQKRYGVDNWFKDPANVKQREKTYLDRFGVTHPMQNREICVRSHTNRTYKKTYKFSDGGEVGTSGNGILVLEALDLAGYSSYDIETEVFKGVTYQNSNGSLSRHIFDVFIPKENLVIEAKTLSHPRYGFEADKEKIFSKKEASVALGFDYEIWVYDNKGNLTIF